MAFIVLTKTIGPKGKVHYEQFGERYETIEEARKAAQFPNLRDPIILDLKRAEKVENQALLRLQRVEGHSPVRPQGGSRGRPRR